MGSAEVDVIIDKLSLSDEGQRTFDNCYLPYKISHNPILGRYLIAARDIKKGEVILIDKPLATGPIRGSCSLICPGCYDPNVNGNCDRCGWPICSDSCSGLRLHQEMECKLISSQRNRENILEEEEEDWNSLCDWLMVVRCLLLKQCSPHLWKKLMKMETNWKEWLRSPHFSSAAMLEPTLRSGFGLSPELFGKQEILKVQAILDINVYEVRLPLSNVQAAYHLASLAEHSCLPNSYRTISSSFQLTLYAAQDIPKGFHISTSYCDILWPSWHRQQYLQWSKFFICACERCLSPSEVNSNLSSLICQDCQETAHPILLNSTWENLQKTYECSSSACAALIPARDAYLTSKTAEDELSELDNDAAYETIPSFENWLNKWTVSENISGTTAATSTEAKNTKISLKSNKLLLHPHHSLVLDCCHTLFLLYPKEESSCFSNSSNFTQLKRKETLGTHLLTATKSLFTGISKFRGTISYELALTKGAILVSQVNSQEENGNLQVLAEEIMQLLTESKEMLKLEPSDQPEGKLGVSAAEQLKEFKEYFEQIFEKDYKS